MGVKIDRARIVEIAYRELSSFTGRSEAELSRDDRIIEDLGVESLDVVEMVANVEEELGFELELDVPGDIVTVGDLVDELLRTVAVAGG